MLLGVRKMTAFLVGALALFFIYISATPETREAPAPAPQSVAVEDARPSAATTTPLAPSPTPKPPPASAEMPILPDSPPAPPSASLPTAPTASSSPVSPPPAPALSFDELNVKTRAALVNIICTTLRSGLFEPLSGSGVIIDPRGVILTNAHVAEYFLLKDYLTKDFLNCVIRTGSPARNRYRARLLYISPLWMKANYQKIRISEASGTGENDFALLLISESVNPTASPLPETYPFLHPDFTDEAVRRRNYVLVAGYPAGFLSGISVQKELYPSSSVVETGEVFTFRERTPDLFSIGSSPLAQQGASGGAVVSGAGNLVGLIVTATDARTTGERDLHAITPSHIAQSFTEDTGKTLEEFFQSDLSASAENFARDVAPALTELLENELNRAE